MENKAIIEWLTTGDVSIKYQSLRDLTNATKSIYEPEREKISEIGWGKKLLDLQTINRTWGGGLYSPKWTSTTYTLTLLRRLQMLPNKKITESCKLLLDKGIFSDGGINLWASWKHSETCVTGMLLAVFAFFKVKDERLDRMANYLLNEQMKDGGWNCQKYKGDTHSSFHTTIHAMEGLWEYSKEIENNKKLIDSIYKGIEFLLQHKLFKSHRTDEIVDKKMISFPFPPRWHYDIMYCLDFMQMIDYPIKDVRFKDAIEILKSKQLASGLWKMNAGYSGRKHFELEPAGKPSRINTLRALRILNWWQS